MEAAREASGEKVARAQGVARGRCQSRRGCGEVVDQRVRAGPPQRSSDVVAPKERVVIVPPGVRVVWRVQRRESMEAVLGV